MFVLVEKDTYVLCRIFEKSGSGPKNGEKYGAPFVEEEWESFGEQVLPLPPVDNEPLKLEGFASDVDELVNPLAVSVPDDVLVDPLDVFYDELWKENLPDSTYEDFFETHDLDQVRVASLMMLDCLLFIHFCAVGLFCKLCLGDRLNAFLLCCINNVLSCCSFAYFLIKLLLGWRFIYLLSWPSFQICFGTDFVIVLTFSVE